MSHPPTGGSAKARRPCAGARDGVGLTNRAHLGSRLGVPGSGSVRPPDRASRRSGPQFAPARRPSKPPGCRSRCPGSFWTRSAGHCPTGCAKNATSQGGTRLRPSRARPGRVQRGSIRVIREAMRRRPHPGDRRCRGERDRRGRNANARPTATLGAARTRHRRTSAPHPQRRSVRRQRGRLDRARRDRRRDHRARDRA